MANNLGVNTYTVGGDYDVWGTAFIADLAILNKFAGDTHVVTATSGTVTLTTTQCQNFSIQATGGTASTVDIRVPDAIARFWYVRNDRATGSITVRCAAGGTTITLAAGERRLVYSNGTDCADLTLLTLAIASVSGLQAALDAKQPLDSDLTAIAALTTTSFGRALLALADEAAFKAAVNLEAGVDYQAYSATLLTLASATAAGLALMDDADAAAQRTTLGLGSVDNLALAGANEAFIPAGAFLRQATNGAAEGLVELATTLQPLETLDFDTTTQEFAVFPWAPPKRWSLGTITYQAYWTAASGSGTAGFLLEGVAISDDDALNTAYGTAVAVIDTLLAANDLHISPVSTAVTIAGTPADADLVWLRIKRDVATDTLAVDAKLIGVKIFYTVDQGNDA